MRFATRKTAPLREQVKDLYMIKDRLLYEEKNEITLDDINYVYGLRYFQRKRVLQRCGLTGLIIFSVLFLLELYKKGFIA